MKKSCVAMLLAGGQGSRLRALTAHMAKPAVPFGGKYRIIDFPLSNCINSGIDTVGVLTQYRPMELNAYIGSGQPWDLDRTEGGVHILPPYIRSGSEGSWYRGTANAVYQNLDFLEQYSPDYVLILSGDHIYKMNYSKMLSTHIQRGADCTISVIDVPRREATRFGVLSVDDDGIITEFEEKPAIPKSTLASMGIYIFDYSILRHYLTRDDCDTSSNNDFGKDVIPAMLRDGRKLAAHRFVGYWKDVGTVESLWDANMDLLSPDVLDLFDDSWVIYSRTPTRPPHYVGNHANISHSVVTKGSFICGSVANSVIFNSVTVEEGASVSYSILMPGTVVEAGAVVSYSILGENSVVGAGAVMGSAPEDCDLEKWGITSCGEGIRVASGAIVPPGSVLWTDFGGSSHE